MRRGPELAERRSADQRGLKVEDVIDGGGGGGRRWTEPWLLNSCCCRSHRRISSWELSALLFSR